MNNTNNKFDSILKQEINDFKGSTILRELGIGQSTKIEMLSNEIFEGEILNVDEYGIEFNFSDKNRENELIPYGNLRKVIMPNYVKDNDNN